ncbi:MAG TPA: 50S ribosomal protein L25 [Bacillota bacterium]|nr:50S ribosomal protein L25 [Bacillota bacterium]
MERELEALARRDKTGSSKRGLKERGMIPAVVYGKNIGSISIAVDAEELKSIIEEAGTSALISMKIRENGKLKRHKVLLKAVQRDPIRRNLVHADFHQVSVKDRVHATVPVHLAGSAPGVTAGGVLTPLMRRLEVECLAAKIPDSITVDVSALDIGDAVTVADLQLPPDVRVTGDKSAPVVTVAAPEKPAAEAPAPAGEEQKAAGEAAEEEK